MQQEIEDVWEIFNEIYKKLPMEEKETAIELTRTAIILKISREWMRLAERENNLN